MTADVCYFAEIITLMLFLCHISNGAVEDHGHEDGITSEKNIEIYRRLLHQKRLDQLSAVQQIAEIDTYEKQYSMVEILLQKMASVLSENVIKLRESGYTPGDDFPTEETQREALSLVVENTALFGDILLRLPDITHRLLQTNKEWDLLLKSCVGFVNETRILQEVDTKLINFMAQELDLLEKDPNYINPFKNSQQKDTDDMEDAFETPQGKKTKSKPDVKKGKLKRGPRMSGKRVEL